VGREDGKKGSQRTFEWRDVEQKDFEDLKRRMAQTLSLNQPCLDPPFYITSDASDQAVGAQLCQDFDGVRKTVALFSRKLTPSQLNCAVKEGLPQPQGFPHQGPQGWAQWRNQPVVGSGWEKLLPRLDSGSG